MKLPFGVFSKNVGIDLGTANSLIYLEGRGIVVNEPSVAAVNGKTGQVLAIGEEAKKMTGRTPAHINIIRPLTNGVISDFDMTQEMLRHLLKKVGGNQMLANFKKAVVGVPSGLTEVERKSVEDAIVGAGVSRAYVIESAIAAAIGARLPIEQPSASIIIDIGGGTSEIAVISMSGIVRSKSLKVAGDKLTDDIMRFIREEFKLAIGEPTAEELKINIGAAIPQEGKLEMAIRGRDLATGLPKEVVVKEAQVRTAIGKSLRNIIDAIREVIEITPPELAGDILKTGVYLCGGGSLLRGLDKLVARELNVAVSVVDDPLTCVARGTGALLENLDKYDGLFHDPLNPKDIKL